MKTCPGSETLIESPGRRERLMHKLINEAIPAFLATPMMFKVVVVGIVAMWAYFFVYIAMSFISSLYSL